MKALLLERGRLWVDTLPEPEPGPGELLVRTLACGICGSDLHAHQHTEQFIEASLKSKGAFQLTTYNPVVLGHEFCAEILDSSPAAGRNLKPGTRVCSVPVLWRNRSTVPIGFSEEVPGGFAEFMVLSERLVLPVPAHLSPPHAALSEPSAVAKHAVAKSRAENADCVLVLGAGPVGILVLVELKRLGLGPIVVSEPNADRRRLAERIGADVIMDPNRSRWWLDPAIRKARQLVAFECVGIPNLLSDVYEHAPRHSQIVVVGVCLQPDTVSHLPAINKELNVQYVLGYTLDEYAQSLTDIAEGSIDIEPVVTDVIGLDGAPAAFTELANASAQCKVIVDPSLEWGDRELGNQTC